MAYLHQSQNNVQNNLNYLILFSINDFLYFILQCTSGLFLCSVSLVIFDLIWTHQLICNKDIIMSILRFLLKFTVSTPNPVVTV